MRSKSFRAHVMVAAFTLLASMATFAQVPPAGSQGLDWDGSAPGPRMLYWHNVPPVYPMTVFAKVYMRSNAAISRQDGCKYGTIFFWGNDGKGLWDNSGSQNNSYWGIEPYPRALPGGSHCPKGPWRFEIATWNRDYVTRLDGTAPDIVNDRWYSLALVASRPGGNGTQSSHVAWVDLPATTNVSKIQSAPTYNQPRDWTEAPPKPAIFFGQSPVHPSYPPLSWGGYYGWDECNCVIRGIQMYTVALTQAQVVALQACETDQCVVDTAAAQGVGSSLWFLNMNPAPTDVTDKSGKGHHGSWNGTGARPMLWTNQGGGSPPGNRPPVISGTPPTNATPGQAYTFTPTSSDPDGNPLTFSITNRPSWATFNTSTGRLSGTPSSAGNHANIGISVSDGQASAALAPFTITVTSTNRPPAISGTPQTSVLAGQSYTFTPTSSDPDGDALTFSVTNLPVWAAFNTATGRVYGVPTAGHVGTYSNIVIRVTDARGASASLAAFTITVTATANGSVTLDWTPPTHNTDGSQSSQTLAGYRIYWGTSQGNYANSRTFNNPGLTSAVIDQLPSATYFFTITALNTNGSESSFSNEVSTSVN